MDDALRDINFTDSFALGFERHGDEFWIRALFSLKSSHIRFSEPTVGDYTDYKHGWLKIRDIIEPVFNWASQTFGTDPSGEIDFGTFENAYYVDGRFICEGEWGTLSMKCTKVELTID